MMTHLYALTAHAAHALLARKEISARELLDAVYARIDAVDGAVHSYVLLMREAAYAAADAVDARLAAGEAIGPLDGIPLALKDILCTTGVRTTCCSRILENFIPPYDAAVVERLRAAGVIPVGKTNMDEFAMGSSTENSAFGPSHNPWDLARVPGGSSGGSASAMGADEALIAIGTDTGGSIRQPAAYCGVVGLKPTYGRVSRYGLIAFASSLDQIGPITKDVRDAALVMNAIAGPDPRDSTCLPEPAPDCTALLGRDITGMRVGVPRELFSQEGVTVAPGVEAAVRAAIALLERLGAVVEECSLPHARFSLPTYYIIAPAEASSNLARYDGVEFGYRAPGARDTVTMMTDTRDQGFGAEVKRRIMLGTYALSSGFYDAFYLKASQVRTLIRRDFEQAFETFDVLVSPTAPTVAFPLGAKVDDPIQMYLNDICTIPINMAGIPAISVPCGDDRGLPVGLHLMAAHWQEPKLLQVAHAYEQAAGWTRKAVEEAGRVTIAG
ncbi:MAG TPA: Asp-tRNA(Asn)/Glu-tRNA(Gln) amidotransferase subunit GatA [Armatimonadota bacterium]|nr:Asp-tRNA(Asn)/Glu-tRNA(Gln) amidotransferase subunit GatA [Armatimonadota bacterium]HOS42353.1 Asp-tRNA(Asn)/Glu-tRNA(Gln) amidotransferase subunit GatA [Armatimonadota bacterium]